MEISRIQEDAVTENANKAMKFGLKVFKGQQKLTDVRLTKSFKTCPWQSQISLLLTNPAAKSLFGFGRNKYRRVLRQKHKLLFNEAPPQGLCARKHQVLSTALRTRYNFRFILRQLLLHFSFQVEINHGGVLQVGF